MPKFQVGDKVKHYAAGLVYTVLAVFPIPDRKFRDMVIGYDNNYYFADSSQYDKVEEKFEVGKRYKFKGDMNDSRYTVVEVRGNSVIGWVSARNGASFAWTPMQHSRHDYVEAKDC